MITTPPPDFCVKYRWCEGTVPPPDYYEFSIAIGPGKTGVITFYPDYPQHDLPVWVEHFNVSDADLLKLFNLMGKKNLFRQAWTEIEAAPVGGSLEWLQIISNGVEYNIPSLIEEALVVEKIYIFIRSFVPDEIWHGLKSRHHKYQAEYSE